MLKKDVYRLPRYWSSDPSSIINYGSTAPMTNEEVLEFVWGMTKISVIKPGSPRATQ
jgi:hypothetical protein